MCFICQVIQKFNLGYVKLFFEDLFIYNNEYSNLVFFYEDQFVMIKVNMKFVLYLILEFDEVGGMFSVIGCLKMVWFDNFVIEKYVL